MDDTGQFTRTMVLSDGDLDLLDGKKLPSLTLQVFHRDGVQEVPLSNGSAIVLGRSPRRGVAIRDSSLSREHVRVVRQDGEVWLEDLGSTNGTRVDGEPVATARIEPGASLAFGRVLATLLPALPTDGRAADLLSHDRFVRALHQEIARAADHRRSVALLMFRSHAAPDRVPGRWLPLLRQRLRPYDQLALYSSDTIEVLLPELDAEGASRLATEVVAAADGACAGLGAFPAHGSSAEELLDHVLQAARAARPSRPLAMATLDRGPARALEAPTGPVIRSEAMRTLFELVDKLAPSSIPVLIEGETGTGKELVARALHERGPRGECPLVAVNCGAIPGELVESTLFGHEKGAFTGATQRKRGVFEAADGGTVFLDEIGELPAQAQATLLRVLETRRVTRVGSTAEVEVDVRVLAATHQDLAAMAQQGGFRRDLVYRLNAMTLCIPPLRERRDDVQPLVQRFVERFDLADERGVHTVTDAAMELLWQYDWPGNVRELRNAVERAVVICAGDAIDVEDLPAPIRALAGQEQPEVAQHPDARSEAAPAAQPAGDGLRQAGLKQTVQQYEADLILGALRRAGFDRPAAAKELGLPLRTLSHKMKVYGLRPVDLATDRG